MLVFKLCLVGSSEWLPGVLQACLKNSPARERVVRPERGVVTVSDSQLHGQCCDRRIRFLYPNFMNQMDDFSTEPCDGVVSLNDVSFQFGPSAFKTLTSYYSFAYGFPLFYFFVMLILLMLRCVFSNKIVSCKLHIFLWIFRYILSF